MAITVTVVKRTKFNNLYANIVNIALDSSYPTGGESITPAQLGLTTVDFVLPSPAAGYIPEFDHAAKKLKMFTPTTNHDHTENTAATYTQNATTAKNAASVAVEVANTTDLSSIVVRALAVGL